MFEFDSFRVDALRRLLLNDGQKVRLPSKAFEILVVLLEAEGRLVEKDELMQRVWPDAVVEGSLCVEQRERDHCAALAELEAEDSFFKRVIISNAA